MIKWPDLSPYGYTLQIAVVNGVDRALLFPNGESPVEFDAIGAGFESNASGYFVGPANVSVGKLKAMFGGAIALIDTPLNRIKADVANLVAPEAVIEAEADMLTATVGDAVPAAPDFWPDASLIADIEGAQFVRGRGLIKDHYGVALADGVAIGNFHKTPEAAAAEAIERLAIRKGQDKAASARQEQLGLIRARLLSGQSATDKDLGTLELKSVSQLAWFIPAAAELFGISSKAVRPYIKDFIRVSRTDLGRKVENVAAESGLNAIARGVAQNQTDAQKKASDAVATAAEARLAHAAELKARKAARGNSPPSLDDVIFEYNSPYFDRKGIELTFEQGEWWTAKSVRFLGPVNMRYRLAVGALGIQVVPMPGVSGNSAFRMSAVSIRDWLETTMDKKTFKPFVAQGLRAGSILNWVKVQVNGNIAWMNGQVFSVANEPLIPKYQKNLGNSELVTIPQKAIDNLFNIPKGFGIVPFAISGEKSVSHNQKTPASNTVFFKTIDSEDSKSGKNKVIACNSYYVNYFLSAYKNVEFCINGKVPNIHVYEGDACVGIISQIEYKYNHTVDIINERIDNERIDADKMALEVSNESVADPAETEIVDEVSLPLAKKTRISKAKAELVAGEPEASKQSRLNDVGDALLWNKKSVLKHGLTWETVSGLNDTLKVKMAVRDKIWPKPDWVKIYESFDELDREKFRPILYMFNKVYQAIPTKSNPHYSGDTALKIYTDNVVAYREYVLGVIGNVAEMDILWREFVYPAQCYYDANSGNRANSKVNLARFIFQQGYTYDFRKVQKELYWSIHSTYSALNELKKSVWPKSQEEWQRRGFKVQTKAALLAYNSRFLTRVVVEPNASKVDVIARLGMFPSYKVGSFSSVEEAAACKSKTEEMEWVVTHTTKGYGDSQLLRSYTFCESEEHGIELARIAAKRKDLPGETNDQTGEANESEAESDTPWTRRGPTVRDGDVTAKQLMDTFGFRGVNYGNWVSQTERQDFSNAAWDALHDLARVLKLPAKALSLNGFVGLAFGAQGGGGKAAAHFVPGVNEINLTKTKGAGCLAHEWAHALDHYYGIKAGLARVADKPFASWMIESNTQLRPEFRSQFLAVRKSLTVKAPEAAKHEAGFRSSPKTDLMLNSMAEDKGKAKPYWATYHELFARSFETWVIDTLAAEGNENQFLASTRHTASVLWPSGDERIVINRAFDALIDTLKTENDVLMSARIDVVEQPVNTVEGVQLAIKKQFGADALDSMKNLRIVFHADEITDLIVGSKDQALFDARTGKITLIASRITKGTECAVLLHELSHKNLEKSIGKSALKRLGEVVTYWRNYEAGSPERQVYESANARASASENYSREFLAYAIEEAETICRKQPGVFATVERWLLSVERLFTVAINKLMGTKAENRFKALDLVAIANGAAKLEMQAPGNQASELRAQFQDQLLPFPSVSQERIDGVLQYVPSTDPGVRRRYMMEANALANLPPNEFAMRQEISNFTDAHIVVSGHYLGSTSEVLMARQWEVDDPDSDAYSHSKLAALRDARVVEHAQAQIEADETTMGAG